MISAQAKAKSWDLLPILPPHLPVLERLATAGTDDDVFLLLQRAEVEMYLALRDGWSAVPPFPKDQRHWNCGFIGCGSRIYAVAGAQSPHLGAPGSASLSSYDGREWTILTTCPRAGPCVAVNLDDERLLVSWYTNRVTDFIALYFPAEDRWTGPLSLPKNLLLVPHGMSLAMVPPKIGVPMLCDSLPFPTLRGPPEEPFRPAKAGPLPRIPDDPSPSSEDSKVPTEEGDDDLISAWADVNKKIPEPSFLVASMPVFD